MRYFGRLFKAITKTGQNIKSELLNTLGEYGITCDVKKHVVFVTDKGANIKKALEFFHWIPCFCHILNTILCTAFKMKSDDPECIIEVGESDDGSGIECVQTLLEAVKQLVTYLKRSGLASKLSTTVVQECVTRWNTKLAVLQSVQKVFPEIQSLL